MYLRTSHNSRTERVASLATATGVTVGTAILILVGLRPTFVRETVAAPAVEARQVSEYVVYVAPPVPAPVVVSTRETVRPSVRATSRPVAATPARGSSAAPRVDSASNPPVASKPRTTTVPRVGAAPTRSTAGAPAAGATVGFTHASPEPIRFDSAVRSLSERLAAGIVTRQLVPLPPTQAEIDAKYRDEAFEAVAARGSGTPLRRTMAGGSIPVPLPLGGPSRKQRDRDRAIYAELKETVALRQKRVDSLVAARRRRADSLARVSDTLRRDTTSQQ
jgi:hypothetical protein